MKQQVLVFCIKNNIIILLDNPSTLIDTIHKTGMKAGIAIKPQTPVSVLFPFVDRLDMVLIMTGFFYKNSFFFHLITLF